MKRFKSWSVMIQQKDTDKDIGKLEAFLRNEFEDVLEPKKLDALLKQMKPNFFVTVLEFAKTDIRGLNVGTSYPVLTNVLTLPQWIAALEHDILI